MTGTNKLTLLALCFVSAFAPGTAQAQGLLIPRPIPPIPAPRPLTVKSQKVTMALTDGAAKIEVEQLFYNPNGRQLEGTYLFPLPPGATVSNFRMTIDKEPVEGKMLTVEEARRVYESYVRRNIDPAILEYVGRNAFQARVFPIPPNGEKRISLTYSQAMPFSAGIYQAVYPLNSERVTGETAGDLLVDCTIRSATPLKAVYSPTHEVQVKRENDHRARVTFEGKDVRANRDFVLYYSISEKAFGLNALEHRRAGEDGYLMMMLAPKTEIRASDVQPKDVVVVFDTSGSMQGTKIEQARKALLTVLGALNERDRFNVVRFSSDVENFRPSVVAANAENRAAAKTFVEGFRAVGGTAIDDAMAAGLASFPKADERRERAPFLIFMTDGLPTIGETDPAKILQNSGKGAPADLRLFSFGVGADVNTLLLDRLASDHHGAADYISQDEDLETRIGSFYQKIAEPVLSNVAVTVNGAKLTDVFPAKTPDLFAGTQLLLLGRYSGQGKATVTLTGELNGKPQRYSYDVSLPERELAQDFIPKLWANRKIGFLLEQIRLNGENKELKDEVIRLSKEFGIVTPYTAYLVEEPGMQPPGLVPLSGAVRFEDRAGGLGAGAQGGSGFGGGGFGRGAGVPGPGGPPGTSSATTAPSNRARAVAPADPYYAKLGQLRREAEGFKQDTGRNAVEASKRLKSLKDKELAETDLEVARTVEGRSFRLANGVWNDEKAADKKLKVVEVKYGSDAYFRLISAKAEWARLLSVGKQVRFRSGPTTVVAVGEKGKEKLTDAELKALSE